jgi:hypothetical protein
MLNLDEPFNRYMGVNAPIERFNTVADVLVEPFFPPNGVFQYLPPGEAAQVPWVDKDPHGDQYYGFHILKRHWATGIDINSCGEHDKNYFIQLQFRWYDGGSDIELLIYYITYRYLEKNSLDRLPISTHFFRLQTAFKDELHRKLRLLPSSLDSASWKPTNRGTWQKAKCTIPADSTIRQIKEWFEAQSRTGERLIDETIESVLA